jgi:chemotaxis protein histidine kinase CheA
MSKEGPIETFMPPNLLKAKVGGSGGVFEASVLKRAEGAIGEFKEEFSAWLIEDVNRLTSAREAYASARSDKSLAALYRAAHDLKGQGTTFDYPLVTRIAGSLCKLREESQPGCHLPLNLIDAHVDAIKVIVRNGIKDSSNQTASVLALELERQVLAFLAPKTAA